MYSIETGSNRLLFCASNIWTIRYFRLEAERQGHRNIGNTSLAPFSFPVELSVRDSSLKLLKTDDMTLDGLCLLCCFFFLEQGCTHRYRCHMA